MSNPTISPSKLSSKISMWENAFNSKTETKPSRNVPGRRRAHTMASIFENGNGTTQCSPKHRHSTTAKVSSIKPDRLKRFSDSGEKYFKILIEPIPVYQDKWLRIAKPVSLHKDQIVAGTYVSNKIVLLADPYHVYCDASHVEPVDISHATYVQQTQKFNEMLSTVHQQLDDIMNREASVQEECKETECVFLSEDEFANNIIHCRKDTNGVDLSDKFIHVQIDDNDPTQIQSAANLASMRAFQSRFVPPIADISKGKAFGQMSIFLPSGLTKKQTFNGERTVYRGTANFTVSNSSAQTFN
eukprot:144568_1